MNILIVDNQTKHLEEICRLLPDVPTVIRWDTLSTNENDALGRDLIILSGGTDIPPVAEYEEFFLIQKSIILGSSVPIVGVCLGAQIIARTFEADLRDLGKKREGIVTVTPTEAGTNLLGIRSPFSVAEAHRFVIPSLPDSFDILATSSDGIEIFKHKERPLWGLQFHPEYLPGETSGDEVFANILRY